MTNRDLLKEAIADAKAVKEVAITNAKAALEEAFTPHLKSMLEQKLTAMEENDYTTEETMHNTKRKEVAEVSHDDEDIDLEELLRELEGEDAEETEEDSDVPADDLEDTEEETEEDEELDFDNMTAEDLESFIEKVVDEMIAAGELEGGHEGMEDELGAEMDMEEPTDEEPMQEPGEIMAEGMDLVQMVVDAGVSNHHTAQLVAGALGAMGIATTGLTIAGIKKLVNAMKGSKSMDEADHESEMKETNAMHDAELEEAYNAINTLKSELNEINLLNSKLLYTNKIFKAKNLSEAQKVQILTAFDKAETVKETKLVYETLSSNLNKSDKRELVKENRSFASKTISGTSNKQPVMETSAMVERFQKLAGLK
mgnify:CR=1 FL=1